MFFSFGGYTVEKKKDGRSFHRSKCKNEEKSEFAFCTSRNFCSFFIGLGLLEGVGVQGLKVGERMGRLLEIRQEKCEFILN